MADDPTAIQALIQNFFATETADPNITNYRGVFYLALPKDYKCEIEKDKKNIIGKLKNFVGITGMKELASWNISDESLKLRLEDLPINVKHQIGSKNMQLFGQSVEKLEKDEYLLALFKNELLPVLKELEDGVKPTRYMQSVIETAQHHELDMFHRRGNYGPLGPDGPLTEIHSWGFSDRVSAFLSALKDEIVKETGVKQVVDFKRAAQAGIV